VKSLRETQPFAGCTNGPVDVHEYLEGSEHCAKTSVAGARSARRPTKGLKDLMVTSCCSDTLEEG